MGKFKEEACGIPIIEFIGLRSKMYSYIKDNETFGRTAKGIKKNVIKITSSMRTTKGYKKTTNNYTIRTNQLEAKTPTIQL